VGCCGVHVQDEQAAIIQEEEVLLRDLSSGRKQTSVQVDDSDDDSDGPPEMTSVQVDDSDDDSDRSPEVTSVQVDDSYDDSDGPLEVTTQCMSHIECPWVPHMLAMDKICNHS
jgi:hypothetical protein